MSMVGHNSNWDDDNQYQILFQNQIDHGYCQDINPGEIRSIIKTISHHPSINNKLFFNRKCSHSK